MLTINTGVQRLGALPYKGIVTDTKVAIQAILPDVFDVIPGEVEKFVQYSDRVTAEGIAAAFPQASDAVQ